MRWRMKYPAVDDLVASRGRLDLIWADGRGFGPCRSCRGSAPGSRRQPVSRRLAAPVREPAGRLREDANGIIQEMARIIVNDFPAGPARGGRGSAPTPAAQIAIVARELAANDTTLRFSQSNTGERASALYFAQPRTPPGHSSSPARRRPMVRRHPRGAARTCRKGEFRSAGSGSFLRCSSENDSRCIRIGNSYASMLGSSRSARR
jgi:hypothetical protein